MRTVLLVLALMGSVLVSGSTAPAPAHRTAGRLPATIVGWNPVPVVAALERLGYQCEEQTLATGNVSRECSTPSGEAASRTLTVTGPRPAIASMVVAMLTLRSGTLSGADRAFLASIARVPYRGSRAATAEAWLRSAESYGNPALTQGDARLGLNVSHDRRVWTLTEVALSAPVDACPCHSQ